MDGAGGDAEYVVLLLFWTAHLMTLLSFRHHSLSEEPQSICHVSLSTPTQVFVTLF